ncbi:hypothetical protein [Pasteurella multocida]|uniref:hypothetical protein n=1 Tax=Pasteurella multocida TaxID=747 RepID=UPI00244A15CB|nr:hypothetical protein [Pasteurella multocida]MDH3003459.1 hypothetical protein [Pasteurella multocida]
MNIIEIYNKNHDTVFITRSCKKVKVDSFDTAFTVGEYITRDGRKAIIHYDISGRLPDDTHPLIGEVQGVQQKWEKSGHNYVEALRLIGLWVEKPYTITVNGKEFHPVKNPKEGEELFYVNIIDTYICGSVLWDMQRPIDAGLVNLNLVYRTWEEAQAFLDEITKPNAEIKINE